MKTSFKQQLENSNSTPIDNNEIYHDWLYFEFMKDKNKYDEYNKYHKLLACNINKFKTLFGKQDGIYIGEFRHYVWKREFKGKLFLLFTAKGKGTGIEIVPEKPFDRRNKTEGKIMIEFVKDLMDKLNKGES